MHCVDLGESFQTNIWLQNLASIQPRTSPVKFARSPCKDPIKDPPGSWVRSLTSCTSWGTRSRRRFSRSRPTSRAFRGAGTDLPRSSSRTGRSRRRPSRKPAWRKSTNAWPRQIALGTLLSSMMITSRVPQPTRSTRRFSYPYPGIHIGATLISAYLADFLSRYSKELLNIWLIFDKVW